MSAKSSSERMRLLAAANCTACLTSSSSSSDDTVVANHVARMEAEERAYRLREEQGVTQKELANRMSLTQPTISALESGDLDRSGLATLKA
jgi:DNA-binding XRE family transcriptional regulator